MTAFDSESDVRAALELAIKAVTAYERPDLLGRLEDLLEQAQRPDVQVVIVGEFKQGKSSLINALLNVNACAVDDDIATAVHTVLKYGEEEQAFALVNSADSPDDEIRRVPIEFSQLRAYTTELGTRDPSIIVRAVEIELPRKLLADGLILIDTPGVGGLASSHAAVALGAMSLADAAIFVTDAGSELTHTEANFLAQAVQMVDQVLFVTTKVDLYPNWRRVVELNTGHLARLGLSLPTLCVSSMLRLEAVRTKDKEINAESGFGNLVQHLTNEVVGAGRERTRVMASRAVATICDQVASGFEAEQATLENPASQEAIQADLDRAVREAEVLMSQVARWQITLNDGIQDLTRNVDYDMQRRIRAVRDEAKSSINEFDPADVWDEFKPWLETSLANSVVANYSYLSEAASALSREVASHFGGQSDVLVKLHEVDASEVFGRIGIEANIDPNEDGVGAKGLTALRGGYSGFLMVSMLGSFVLPPLAIPVFGGLAGALLSRKAVKDERERNMARRRNEALQTVNRYCDEVNFQVRHDSNETLRTIQRQIRDHYEVRAKELQKSSAQAKTAASKAAKLAAQDRVKRLRDVKAELERLDLVRQRGAALVAPQDQVAQ